MNLVNYQANNTTSDWIGIIMAILTIIGLWGMFIKAGEKGWKSIFPFYNGYILCKIAGCTKLFFIELISALVIVGTAIPVSVMGVAVMMFGEDVAETEAKLASMGITILALLLIMFIAIIVDFVAQVLIANNVSKAFGKSIGFTLGIIFLSPIFYLILGFSDSIQYQGNYDY